MLLRRFHRGADRVIARMLVLARDSDAADQNTAEALLEAAKEIGGNGQSRQGQLVQVLAQADRVKTDRGGLAPWIATHLDSTEGAARGIVRSVRAIGRLPELAEPLSSGRVGAPTIRALTRVACAAKGADADVTKAVTATLDTATRHGVGEAVRQVRIFEESVASRPGEDVLAGQRRRSYLRICAAGGGMSRIEGLLDSERATAVRAVLDKTVSAWLRERRSEHAEPAPEHLRTVEQLQAQALTCFAEAFAHAGGADAAGGAGAGENIYGLLLPHMGLHHPGGMPGTAEHTAPVSPNSARTRPYRLWLPTFSTALNVGHRLQSSQSEPATACDLTPPCPQHHALIHGKP